MTIRRKVLIIDDDADYRASVRAILETRDYDVVEAESGPEGLAKLTREKPALIILDVMMSCDCEGYGVTWAIKNKEEFSAFRNVPILMNSSIQDTPDDRFSMCPEADMIRPDYYLTKPLDIPRFLKTVESAVQAA